MKIKQVISGRAIIFSYVRDLRKRDINKFGPEYECEIPDNDSSLSMWIFLEQCHSGLTPNIVGAQMRHSDACGNIALEMNVFGDSAEAAIFGDGSSKGLAHLYIGHYILDIIFHTVKCEFNQFGSVFGPHPEEVDALIQWGGDCTAGFDDSEAKQLRAFTKVKGSTQLLQIDCRRGKWRGSSTSDLLDAYSCDLGKCIALKTIMIKTAI